MDSRDIVIITLLLLVVFLVFSGQKRRSFFSPSPYPINSIFDINELSWIPSDIKEIMKYKINYEIVPALTSLSIRSWDDLSESKKTKLLDVLRDDFDSLKASIDSSTIGIQDKSSPEPVQE